MARADLAHPALALAACSANLSFDEALAIIANDALPIGTERIPLSRAGRRILAEPILARIDAPRFDVAAMDGYAMRASDLDVGTRAFDLAGQSYPGSAAPLPIGPCQVAKVTTGAALPAGATQVVPWEHVTVIGGTVVVRNLPARRHIRERGSDFSIGDELLPAGRMIDPRALAVAAAADMATLTVWRRPRVKVIATGNELIASGLARTTQLHQPDSLSAAIELFVRQWGGRPSGRHLLPDDLSAIERAAADAIGNRDVLVLIGGASMGERDFAKAALEQIGLQIRFSKVAIKPGKPVWYGRIGDTHVLGLPGNPTAALTTARLFLAPLLTALGGRRADSALRWSNAPLASDIPANGDREAFLCAAWGDDGVRLVERQSASSQMTLGLAEVLVRRAQNVSAADVGQEVEIVRF
ncbi:MAG: molybdopterin molybdotransferase MoeA [Pseudomonadota bacterium]